jgi:hypothetical protein
MGVAHARENNVERGLLSGEMKVSRRSDRSAGPCPMTARQGYGVEGEHGIQRRSGDVLEHQEPDQGPTREQQGQRRRRRHDRPVDAPHSHGDAQAEEQQLQRECDGEQEPLFGPRGEVGADHAAIGIPLRPALSCIMTCGHDRLWGHTARGRRECAAGPHHGDNGCALACGGTSRRKEEPEWESMIGTALPARSRS